jgi:hypothetical protein
MSDDTSAWLVFHDEMTAEKSCPMLPQQTLETDIAFELYIPFSSRLTLEVLPHCELMEQDQLDGQMHF